MNENLNYDEVEENNFRYILYKSEDDYISELCPTFIMFVEYTGDECYEGCVAMDSTKVHDGGYSTATQLDEIPEYYFVCGNIDTNADYTFTLGLYSDITVAEADIGEENCVGADELFEISL